MPEYWEQGNGHWQYVRIQNTMLNIPKEKETMAVFLFSRERRRQTVINPADHRRHKY